MTPASLKRAIKLWTVRTGEKAQQLRAPTVLAEDPDSILSAHMATHCLKLQF